MAAPRKDAAHRQSVVAAIGFTPAEADTLNLYCAAVGKSRSRVFREVLRRMKLSDLSPEAHKFREMQAALPPLEEM